MMVEGITGGLHVSAARASGVGSVGAAMGDEARWVKGKAVFIGGELRACAWQRHQRCRLGAVGERRARRMRTSAVWWRSCQHG